MRPHPWFDLLLHDDDELAALLGVALVERVTLHEWPLSCVQRLRAADGRSWIYKSQAEPSLEPAFYDRARSPLLLEVQALPLPERPAALLLPDLAAPRLLDLQPDEDEALRIGREVLRQIGRIEGRLPAYADLSAEAGWHAYVDALLDDLLTLVGAGTLRQVDQALIGRLERVGRSAPVLAALRSRQGYVHQDLSADNLFVTPDGYRVIDWQRPIWGPVELDLAQLLESLGYDPLRHVEAGVVQLLYLLRCSWFAQCARHWFPAGADFYDQALVELASRL